jgi:hypothetical protein
MNYFFDNVILPAAAAVIGAGCLAVACWHSERALAWIATRSMTRIDVLQAARVAHKDGLTYWGQRFDRHADSPARDAA